MHTDTVTYTDFNGDEQTETLHFHISKTEIVDNLDLEDRFRAILPLFEGGPREWKRSEIETYLGLVKHVMTLAYGVRSEDGKRFRKSPELWDDFQASAVYDAYLFSLFTDPEKANNFLAGVLPMDLRAEAQKQLEANGGVVPDKDAAPVAPTVELEGVLSDEELLRMHPQDMTPEQAKKAYALRFGNK